MKKPSWSLSTDLRFHVVIVFGMVVNCWYRYRDSNEGFKIPVPVYLKGLLVKFISVIILRYYNP